MLCFIQLISIKGEKFPTHNTNFYPLIITKCIRQTKSESKIYNIYFSIVYRKEPTNILLIIIFDFVNQDSNPQIYSSFYMRKLYTVFKKSGCAQHFTFITFIIF